MMASTSALASTLLQCCSRPRASASALSVVVVQTASKSTQSKKSRKRPERPPGPARTPPGTNAKPAPAGRPKRYLTRYGIPPLHPSLTTNDPSKRIDRRAVEKAQRPDFEKIWRLESELAVEQDQAKVKKLREQIAGVRAAQPRRHPLWAFFREKTQADHEDEQEYLSAEQKAEGSSRPGEFSLAVSIQKPVAKIGNSGRSWHAEELRRKSFEDLHTLWYKLVVERNALYTQREEARRSGVDGGAYSYIPEYLHRVAKSMARIKYVLQERRRAILLAQRMIDDADFTDDEERARYYSASNFTESDTQTPAAGNDAAGSAPSASGPAFADGHSPPAQPGTQPTAARDM